MSYSFCSLQVKNLLNVSSKDATDVLQTRATEKNTPTSIRPTNPTTARYEDVTKVTPTLAPFGNI